jgi:hypothetical protein
MAKKKSNKRSKKNGMNIIKITSVVIVAIFIIIIVLGLIKDKQSEPKVVSPTENQLMMVKTIIESSLQNSGDNISNYQFIASKKIIIFVQENNSSETLRACLFNNTTKHIYFIDLNTKQIIMHTQTSTYTNNKRFVKYTREESECKPRD